MVGSATSPRVRIDAGACPARANPARENPAGATRPAVRWSGGALALALATALAGCDWFGEAEAPPLPGERIPVLTFENVVQPDVAVADLPVVLPRPYINPGWPQAGGYPTHALYHLQLDGALRRLWRVDIGDGVSSGNRLLPQPVVADGRVFTLDTDSQLSAYDVQTGERQWRIDVEPEDIDDDALGGGLGYDGGLLFVVNGFAELLAVEGSSGLTLWRVPLVSPVRGSPTISAGRVLVTTIDNQLQAFDSRSGRQVWLHSGVTESAGLLGGASPATDGETVIVPYSSGEVFALSLTNGRTLWNDNIVAARRVDAQTTITDIRGHPVIDREQVVVLGHNDQMVALDLATGTRVWDREIGGVSMPWAGGDFYFILTNNSEVVAVTRSGGQIRWIRPLPRHEDESNQQDRIVWTGPVLASNRLILVGSHGLAYSLSPYDGRILGALELPAGVRVMPMVANNILLILTDDGRLLAYR